VTNFEQTASPQHCFMHMMTGDRQNELLQIADNNRGCPRCGARPRLLRQMLDSCTGKTVRMYECKCGEHSWSE
jgi:hypothetical protein